MIAVSGQAYEWKGGDMLVTCTGGDSTMEINRDDTGYVPVSGAEVTAGVIPAEASVWVLLKPCLVRWTGTGTVSFG